MEHLGADTDIVDLGGGVKGFNVSIDPPAGVPGIGERRDVTVGDCDGDEDAGAGEGFYHIWVHVKDSNAVDDGVGFEEVGYCSWWREVVA